VGLGDGHGEYLTWAITVHLFVLFKTVLFKMVLFKMVLFRMQDRWGTCPW